ncbi:MAG TPA: 5'/3'-nucleotidase SurE [Acidimicrobiales bacterium]|nr:5'/3'-nucleotidase SurE [Acidimicrobiales bacterium]
MRILLTNDDGIDAPGLHALARALKTCGHEVVIAAPARDYSGFGAALGALHVTGQVLFEDRKIEDLLHVEAYAVDGPPALCAFSGALGGFGGGWELLVSGINAGQNQGRAVLFSGTVGAALTACQFGVPAMAVSLAHRPDDVWHWETAAACAASLAQSARDVGTVGVLNVNVPNVRPYALRGMKAARLALGGTVQAAVVEKQPGALEITFERSELADDSDVALLRDGYVTLSLVEVARDVHGDALDAITSKIAQAGRDGNAKLTA